MEYKPNYLFIGLTVGICAMFGALMWLFTARIQIEGEITSWVIRGAFLLSVVLTGFVIYFKFGRANNRVQDLVLWVGIVVELCIMAMTFLTVVHPDLLRGTDIEPFAGLVSGLNVVTTVFVLVLFFAFDESTREIHNIAAERSALILNMQRQQLNSADTHALVREQTRQQVIEQLAKEMNVPSYQLAAKVTPSVNGASAGAVYYQAAPKVLTLDTNGTDPKA